MVEAHTWSEQLELGDEAMDNDHHLQLKLLGALVEAIEARRPGMARRLAEQLTSYSEAHFQSEELLMEARDYDQRDLHATEHGVLVGRMREIAGDVRAEEYDAALATTLALRDHLTGHMTGADKRLASTVRARNTAR